MATVNLTDGDGKNWDITDSASADQNSVIDNGAIDEYDGGFQLSVNGVVFSAAFGASELGGRQQVLTGTASGIAVERRIYVPTDAGEGWARIFDSFTNTGATAVTITVRSQSNSGNDGSFQIIGTSSGDTSFTTADHYIINDDNAAAAGQNGDLPLLTLFGDGTLTPTTVSNTVFTSSGNQGISYTFSLTINPGQTASLLQYASQQTNQGDFASELPTLEAPDTTALFGLTASQIGQVVNFNLGVAGQNHIGTPQPDLLSGGNGPDTFAALASDDTVLGNGGDDTIDGGTGADLLIGGTGNDTYVVDNAADRVIESANEGADIVNTSASWTVTAGSSVETVNASGSAAVNLTGNELAQALNGNGANNVLDGGIDSVVDTLAGGGGNDTYLVRTGFGAPGATPAGQDIVQEAASSGFDTVYTTGSYDLRSSTAEIEVISAADQNSTYDSYLYGNGTAQTIVGNMGANDLYDGGGTGPDVLIGLAGDDVYEVSAQGTRVIEAADAGYDTVFVEGGASFSVGAGNSIEVIYSFSPGTTAITGNEISQVIHASTGADTLVGGGGADTLIGRAGNDVYRVDSLDDVVVENTGDGTDRVISSSSYYLRESNLVTFRVGTEGIGSYGTVNRGFAGQTNEIEVLAAAGYTGSFGGAAGQGDGTLNLNSLNATATTNYFVGNAISQIILGDAGSNILNGYRNGGDETAALGGADTLVGGQGDDQYRVYDQTDVVIEDSAGGGDIIFASADYNLATNDATAATLTNTATGINFANYLSGAGQIEVLSAASQRGNEGTTGLNLTGNGYGNIIIGDYGSNTITGGGTTAGGVDVLIGLRGNDTYYVDSTNTFVNEAAGDGNDAVYVNTAATGFTLNTGSSVETLYSNGANVNITGNELAQAIYGDPGANVLIGGGGADTLIGGDGSDTYVVSSQDMVVTEAAGAGGTDTVYATVSYDLRNGANVEVELLSTQVQSGTDAINLTGNRYSQTIIGNNGNNVLDGDQSNLSGGAGDTLTGLGGNDTYRVYGQNDVVREYAADGSTADVVFASSNYQLRTGNAIESLSASDQSATSSINLTGNEFSQLVIGNAGDNIISGREGNDTLTGAGGNDVFRFDTTLNGTTNVDTITEFSAGDRIGLGSNIFGAVGGTLDSAEFVNGTVATTTDQRIIYDQATGDIFYDADGSASGSAILFAHVTAGTVIAFNDFVVVNPTSAISEIPAVPI